MPSVIDSSYIVPTDGFRYGGNSLKKLARKYVTITVPKADTVAYGDGTNVISAASLGLQIILACGNFVDSAGALVLAAPSVDQLSLNTYDLLTVVDANRATITAKIARVDSNNAGVFYGWVEGIA